LVTLQVSADDKMVLVDQAAVQAAGGFPYRITKPGSYRLSGNLRVPAAANGIVIDASNFSLDLDGFEIICAGGQNAGIWSDFSTVLYSNISVKNGNVMGCWSGIDLSETNYATAETLTVSNYGVVGIRLNFGAIRKNTVSGGSDPGSRGSRVNLRNCRFQPIQW
jgi:hypothetical protein